MKQSPSFELVKSAKSAAKVSSSLILTISPILRSLELIFSNFLFLRIVTVWLFYSKIKNTINYNKKLRIKFEI